MEKLVIYTTQTCPFSRASKHLLKERNIDFEEIDVTFDLKMQDFLFQKTGYETVPLIFCGNKFVGGFCELKELDERGELKHSLGLAA